ncbi:MAG: KH domain-containing protein [Verrucomicrobiota bacterium]
MKYFLEFVLSRLVDHPDDVDVQEVATERGIVFYLTVHPDDAGKIIGKGGRTISSIRALLNAAVAKPEMRIAVKLCE